MTRPPHGAACSGLFEAGVPFYRPDYNVVEHPSDVGFELRASSRARLFADATLVYYDMLVGLDRIVPRLDRVVEVTGLDDGDLMVTLLSECIILTEVEQILFCQARVEEIQPDRLVLRLCGEPVDETRHVFELGIKAVTYHALSVTANADGSWRAHVVFDI